MLVGPEGETEIPGVHMYQMRRLSGPTTMSLSAHRGFCHDPKGAIYLHTSDHFGAVLIHNMQRVIHTIKPTFR